MVIDSSALIVLLLGEPETEQFVSAIAASAERLLSAASYLETAIVMAGRFGPQGPEKLDRLICELSIEIVPFNAEQARLGITSFQQYGRGTGHPAALNYGDCFTYALAKFTGQSVLFKGNDFSRTDLITAVAGRQA
ncbi:MAG TPA: type II toxin-antitoxin system VapC family toxin [Stellaceae bacterium]|nr:type II toxin-antitoxin system VapC family toxin [Stellaceae bacterium]